MTSDESAEVARAIEEKDAEIRRLEKLVYVPGQWRCAKCEFRLTQSNLYLESGTVGPRDESGDKCPNCNSPLWRVSAMDDRNEAFKCANQTFDRLESALARLNKIQRALEDADGCFEAAYAEGLADRMAEKDMAPGSLVDLLHRRILVAREHIALAVSFLTEPPPADGAT